MSQQPAHNTIGLPFIELQSVDSTNNYARTRIHADLARHGMAVFARDQFAGKGQRGKTWLSRKDENIALSILINPHPLPIARQFQLSACVALAVHDFFRNYAGDDTTIKWPNDLYWQDRKAGGILIESVMSGGEGEAPGGNRIHNSAETGRWKWAIAGIGININQTSFSSDLPNPVSLRQITGKIFSPVQLARELCAELEKKHQILIRDGFDPVYDRYINRLYKKGESVKLKKENRVFEAVIQTVLPDGRLLIRHAIEEAVDFGSVQWVQ